jgi:hypothetical protein
MARREKKTPRIDQDFAAFKKMRGAQKVLPVRSAVRTSSQSTII